MMRLMLYVLSLMLLASLIWIFQNNHPKMEPIGLTLQRDYLYLDGDAIMEVDLFINQKDHPLIHLEYHLASYLMDVNQTKRLELSLLGIEKTHEERYLNMAFHAFRLRFLLPEFNQTYVMEDAFLNLHLASNKTYTFSVGRLHVFSKKPNAESMIWTALSGSKKPFSYHSRLHEITVKFEQMPVAIASIDVGFNQYASFWIQENTLTIQLPDEPFLRNAMPFIIHFENGERVLFERFIYFHDYQLLKESGPLVNLYALD